MLLINWEDLYGDKDPVAFVDRRWRYTEEQLAALMTEESMFSIPLQRWGSIRL